MVEIIVLNKNATEEQLDEAINVLRQRQAELNSNYKKDSEDKQEAISKFLHFLILFNLFIRLHHN